jgi:hypothetical protein
MVKDEKKLQKAAERVGNYALQALAYNYCMRGLINDSDLKDRKILLNKIYALYKKEKNPFDQVVVIQTPILLNDAKRYRKMRNYSNAVIFYATFFEHSINEIIYNKCNKDNITDDSINKMLRLNLYDKFTWLLEILKLPSFNKTHIITINEIANKRNTYIHYKFSPEDWTISPKEKNKDIEQLLQKVDLAIKYIKSYLSRITYNNKKSKIDKLLTIKY